MLRAARERRFNLVLPRQVIDEAYRNLRPQTQLFLRNTLERTPHEVVQVPGLEETFRDLVRSEKDIPIALALLAADVDYFVTNDRDFTDPGAVGEQLSRRVQILLPLCSSEM